MHIRDEEIKRLIQYAKGLNTTVRIQSVKKIDGVSADWSIDGSNITIYKDDKTSKIDIVLSLIHELGHHLEHIHTNNRQLDDELNEAIDPEESKKAYRKKIYDWELKSSKWWEIIYKETNCKFNINRLFLQQEFDLWQYEVYRESGEFPSTSEFKRKYKELKQKHKGANNGK